MLIQDTLLLAETRYFDSFESELIIIPIKGMAELSGSFELVAPLLVTVHSETNCLK